MYRVLIPVDTNQERALTQADYVASLPNAADGVEAIVLFVFHGEGDELPEELNKFNTASRISTVRRARDRLEEDGIETNVVEDSGDTAEDILETADEYDVDDIVLGGRKRSPVGKVLLGSVTQSVVLNTDRPVTITGSNEQ